MVERFFIPIHPLCVGQLLTLEGEELRHLKRSLRCTVGDLVEIVNGQGALAQASVQTIHGREATLAIQTLEHAPPIAHEIVLAQALPRFAHLEWILEKGTELGAHAFYLFPGKLSEKTTLSSAQQTRMRNLLIAAMKQCGRLDLPKIQLLPPLLQWTPCSGTVYLFADPHATRTLPEQWTPGAQRYILCIGPEKGWHSQERAHLETQLHAKGICLHSNVLRTETAAVAALSQFYLQI